MTAVLHHRGPDDGGLWCDEASGIALGHRRLSIIDLTSAGHQPMISSCGRCVITFNGEIYNFAAISEALRTAGRPITGASDTAVLVEACAHWGVAEAVQRCVGMFAFALYDRHSRCLTLARDRLGIKPLYWAQPNETFIFGSELKALTTSSLFHPRIDRNALAAYFRYAYVPAPATIYDGVYKLLPGHLLSVPARGAPEMIRYWDASSIAIAGQAVASTKPIDTVEAQARIEELVGLAVQDRMIADVPLGALLSGGIDSTSVVALMQQAASRPVRTFSIGFAEDGYDEARYAEAVARHLGTDHTSLSVTAADAMETIPELAHWYDEPFADSSQIPSLLLSRLTRQYVKVALSGDGGDEIFAGYNRHRHLPALNRRTGWLPGFLRRAGAFGATAVPPAVWDTLAHLLPERRRPHQLGEKIAKAAEAIAAADLAAAYDSTLNPWPAAIRLVPDVATAETRRLSDLVDPVAQLQLADTLTYLPDDILTKVDRASMAASLEVRVPLLDHRLFEYVWTLPRDLLLNGGSKAPLRTLLDRHVPRSLVNRPKAGFALPIDSWLRGPLRDWAEAMLTSKQLADGNFLDPVPVRVAWEHHLSGRRNNQHALWTILMFQSWRQHQVDAS